MIELDISGQISDAVKSINENNYNQIALTINEKSQLQGLIHIYDMMTFLINNYKGQIDFYVHNFTKFENKSNISHCAKNHNLVRCQHNDTLFEVL